MGAHDVLGNRETQSGSAGLARAGLVDSIKALKQSRQMLRRNALPKVLNIKFDAALGSTSSQHNATAGFSILHRIVYEIREYLMNGFPVRQHGRQRFDRP